MSGYKSSRFYSMKSWKKKLIFLTIHSLFLFKKENHYLLAKVILDSKNQIKLH